jgi:hypothetical protein
MPVGGYKQSGVGRENGISSLEHYTQVKSIQVELGDIFPSVFKYPRRLSSYSVVGCERGPRSLT